MRLTLWLVCLLRAVAAFAQDNAPFEEALIATKKGDSLHCYLRTEPEYGSRIFYKTAMDMNETSIHKRDIKSITMSHMYLQNIQLGKRELLMTLLVEGKARLFGHVATGASRRQSFLGMPTSGRPASLLVYALKKGSVYTEVTRERYRDVLSALLYDCPGLVQIMRNKERAFAYEDLDRAVAMYNACK